MRILILKKILIWTKSKKVLLLVSLLTKFEHGDLGEGEIVKFLSYPMILKNWDFYDFGGVGNVMELFGFKKIFGIILKIK